MEQKKHTIIIDAHAHLFPDRISIQATQSIGEFYDLPMQGSDARQDVLIESGDKIGVSRYLICSAATRKDQVQSINDFLATCLRKNPKFLGFAALHPDMDGLTDELDRVIALGLKGIKLHPDFQAFDIDEPNYIPMYGEIAKRKLPILFHMGDPRYDHSAPKRLANVVQKVPELCAIAAHFGGYQRWDEAAQYLQEGNIYFDTSSTLAFLSKEKAMDMIKLFGPERFMFGVDFPMWEHVAELERFYHLGLSFEEEEQILHKTFETLFYEALKQNTIQTA